MAISPPNRDARCRRRQANLKHRSDGLYEFKATRNKQHSKFPAVILGHQRLLRWLNPRKGSREVTLSGAGGRTSRLTTTLFVQH